MCIRDRRNFGNVWYKGNYYLAAPRFSFLITFSNNYPYYSFKIFPRFWLVKNTHIIYHNQLLLTKFEKNFVILNRWRQNDVKSAAWLQVIQPLTEKTWGQGWVVLVVRTKWRNCRGTFHSFHLEVLSKNIARTARKQLDGQDLLLGVYLQTLIS